MDNEWKYPPVGISTALFGTDVLEPPDKLPVTARQLHVHRPSGPTLLSAQLQQVSKELRSLFHEIRYNSVVQQLFLHVPFQQYAPSGGHLEGPNPAKSLSSATESTVGFLSPISAKIRQSNPSMKTLLSGSEPGTWERK